ncbi:uncharacterized protein K452DRAFT_35890 [Aplosporella prunicola CBS 121167]|uniref:Rhodopsin domain-containing protein n=1 Tax=Aplosporella prunicola CBS 121167 TaxID=1176127 RepID=A0A6A6BD66_9PEZI|nr:uncharacterized protein K452DRAFT_35890 [Aplosporella prunicola CBS 121167]KAF2141164.1 hypothetical protein K452DRAFT_35890 [Aplosporella prunicola CBS 121167]
MMEFQFTPNEKQYVEDRQLAIDHSSVISRKAFEVNIGLFTGLAIVAVAARIKIRIQDMRCLLLDDYILLFATVCLTVSLGILYWEMTELYLLGALTNMPTKIVLSAGEITSMLDFNKKSSINTPLNWIAITAVKFSFLAYFSKLVQNISPKLKTYFWCVIVFTGSSLVFIASSNFINCPYYGREGFEKCPDVGSQSRALGTLIGTTAVDVITDILVISFPVIIIYHMRMSRQRKLAFAAVLSLSLAMIIIAIMRLVVGLTVKSVHLDSVFLVFWQHIEACVAVIVGSLAAFRMAFNRGEGMEDAAVEGTPRKWWRALRSSEEETGREK